MGLYTCQVNQPNDESIQKNFIIETRAPALVSILEKPADGILTLTAGDPLTLTCQGVGDPAPTMQWRRLNSLLPVSPYSKAARLEITSVCDVDAGRYECEASNGFGQPALDSLLVNVKHKPILMLTETYRRHPVTRDIEALLLTCIVRAHPKA